MDVVDEIVSEPPHRCEPSELAVSAGDFQ